MDNSTTGASQESDNEPPAHYGQSSRVLEPTEAIKAEVKRAEQPVAPSHPAWHDPAPTPLPTPTFTPQDPLPPPPPAGGVTNTVAEMPGGDPEHPLAVTEVYSTYGIEYIIMLISLAVAAVSLASVLNAVISLIGKNAGSITSLLDPYSEASLIVSFPIFAYLFLRLEAKEEQDPTLLSDASRRRAMQVVLIASFALGLIALTTFLGGVFSGGSPLSAYSGSSGSSGVTNFFHTLVNVVLAGGVFGFFWYKLHKKTGPL